MSNFIPQDDARRKGAPMFSGLLGYFPAALFEVATHSRESNDKHNPGEELHWARGKSSDHPECIVRHLIDAGRRGTPRRRYHLRALAWRALALLQEECEAEGAAPGVSCRFPGPAPRPAALADLLHPAQRLAVEAFEREAQRTEIQRVADFEPSHPPIDRFAALRPGRGVDEER
jgi:hypothetical protein